MGWQPTLETPLLPFFDGVTARARFAVAPRPPAELPHEPRLLAGATEVDLTPPPGMPKAGYSANAHDGAGFRTRLRARVVHLRAGHASIALVACDLLGGSAVVQHLVAEAIAERTDVPLAGLWIGATHTHAGPGQAGPLEAARVGRGIGAEAAALWTRLEGELAADVGLAAGLRELDLGGGASIDGIDLPSRPAVGAALVAGAHENVTPVIHHLPPFRPGTPKPARDDDPQGAKWVLGGRFQNLVVPLRSFPRVVPVQVLRIGDATLVGLPFELTVETGRRIAADVADHGGASSPDQVVVSSVVNEYAGYIATAEEYARQHYEGGHTLYGPNTQRFMARQAARLAAEVAAGAGSRVPVVSDPVATRSFDLAVHRYLPGPEPDSFARRWIGEARFVDPTRDEDAFWEQTWTDTAPGNLVWHEPMVVVEAADGDGAWRPAEHHGRRVDDQRGDLAVRSLGLDRRTGRPTYRVRWYDPAFRDGRRHRFVLLAGPDRRDPGPAFD